ncbi:MAG: beta-propeller fold lactonase family protein, partial [Pseudomonadales bacterium]
DNTIVSFERDRHGHLTELETVSTLPAGFTGASYCAHLQLSADDRFLYASNRGHDSIVVFATGADGRLSALQWQPTGGCHPRHFALSPDGAKLVTANRDTNNITVFDRHPETGLLTQTGVELSVPAPVCILFN